MMAGKADLMGGEASHANWNGENRLGETLVEVRRRLDGWAPRHLDVRGRLR